MDDGLTVRPVTSATLDDLKRFSGAHGKFSYCSCLRWRLRSRDFRDAADRPATLAALVEAGQPVGVLAYRRGTPVGWCSVAPRESYAAITASRTIQATTEPGVWAVPCFFIAPAERGHGVQVGTGRGRRLGRARDRGGLARG